MRITRTITSLPLQRGARSAGERDEGMLEAGSRRNTGLHTIGSGIASIEHVGQKVVPGRGVGRNIRTVHQIERSRQQKSKVVIQFIYLAWVSGQRFCGLRGLVPLQARLLRNYRLRKDHLRPQFPLSSLRSTEKSTFADRN